MTDDENTTRDTARVRQPGLQHFAQSNPAGEGEGDVAALLRRVADSIDARGDIQIQDVTFHYTLTGEEDDLMMIVYYYDEPRRR